MQTQYSKRLIVWILGSLITVSPFAIDMYLPALAQIAKDFNTTTATVSLSLSSYFIGLAFGQILYGPLLDKFGRKKPLYFGLALFIVASVGCMQSRNIDVFIAFRFLQALGGCVAWVGAMTMVRDFFPVEESARVFSMLVLILGVSPLLAPTLGGFVTSALGWQWIFILLIIIVVIISLVTMLYLPEAYKGDSSVSLRPKNIIVTFISVLKQPQFLTYSLSGAFAFATLFIYLAGSPVIFMEVYKVSPQVYGLIFAFLSVGFIGSSQLNIFLTRKYSSQKIFRVALGCQVLTAIIFLVGVWSNLLGLYETIAIIFILMACVGLINPNASALSLAPFTKNIGSASALLGSTQIGLAALTSSGVGFFNSQDMLPIVGLMVATSGLALVILLIGQNKIGKQVISASGIHENIAH